MAAIASTSSRAPARAQAPVPSRTFFQGTAVAPRRAASRAPARAQLSIMNFKFLKDLGLKKPGFLPDFGLEKRKALLDRFYTSFDAQSLNEVLDDGLKVYAGDSLQPGGKSELVALLPAVKKAIPDFSWTHATAGGKDDAGYSIVKIQAVGYHNGAAFSIPGRNLPPIEPSGKRVRLPEETVKVKVEDGKIQEIRYLHKQAFTAEALYTALGGKL